MPAQTLHAKLHDSPTNRAFGCVQRLTYDEVRKRLGYGDDRSTWPECLFVADGAERSTSNSGLRVRLYRDTSKRTFVVKTTPRGGKGSQQVKLCDVDALPLEKARAAAYEKRLQILNNEHKPAPKPAKPATGVTLREVLERWATNAEVSDGHKADVRSRVELWLAAWLDTPMLAIDDVMWEQRWKALKAGGAAAEMRARTNRALPANFTGDKTRKELRTDFRALWRYFAGTYGRALPYVPPCPTVTTSEEITLPKKVGHFSTDLGPQHLQTLLRSFATYRGNAAHALACELLLLTGMRSKEAFALRWQPGPPKECTWVEGDVLVLPGEFTKNKSEHRAPLGPRALAILQRLRELGETHPNGSTWVFPADSRSGHLTAGNGITKPLRRHSGVYFDLHSFRHATANLLDAVGAQPNERERYLNHRPSTVNHGYGAVSTARLRELALAIEGRFAAVDNVCVLATRKAA